MKYAIDFFVTAATIGVVELAREVEARGFESLWLPDHPVLPADPAIRYRDGAELPAVYGELADPLVSLAAAAAVTDSLRLATGVCVVPERHPLTLAKAVGTLDHLCGGRLLLGVGAGWLRPELELYGVEYGRRWQWLAEAVAGMRELWRNGAGEYAGEYVRFPPVRCEPRPANPAGPPVIIGGPPRPHVLEHVARWADGWFPSMVSPAGIRAARAELARLCAEYGRDLASIEISVMCLDLGGRLADEYAAVGVDRLVAQTYNLPVEAGPIDDWPAASLAARYRAAPSRGDTLRALDRLADQVAVATG